jgi:hypothetical protein
MFNMFNKRKIKEKYGEIIEGLTLSETQKLTLKITWLDYLFLLNTRASKGIKYHHFVQLAVVFLSLTIPIIQGSIYKDESVFGISTISLISLVIAMMTALNNQMKYKDHATAIQAFIAKITSFKRQEINTYLEASKGKKDDTDNKNTAASHKKRSVKKQAAPRQSRRPPEPDTANPADKD